MGLKPGLTYQKKKGRLELFKRVRAEEILGPKSEGARQDWRRLHNTQLRD